MSLAAGLTLAVILLALALLMADALPADVVLVGAVVVLTLGGVITPAEAVAGFSNEGMLTVASLFVVSAGLQHTGAVAWATSRLLGRPRKERGALTRLIAPTIVASAVLNNTTVVATLMPAVHDWARRIGVPASRLLMPLSFAAILGGTCTLIGTSTNLVVAGMISERLGEVPGLVPVRMFDIAPLGIPVALTGALFMVLAGPWLLPSRAPVISVTEDPRRFTTEMLVPKGSPLDGISIEAAGMRHLPGCFLVEVIRGDVVYSAVDNEHLLEEGDRLVLAGDVEAMMDLHRMPGLAAAPDQVFRLDGRRDHRRIVEAVVAANNPLVGQTIRDGHFRNRYRAVVIAVARAGERLPGRIGDIVLHAGDVLLLEAHPDFVHQERRRADFYLVSAVEGGRPPRTDRMVFALVILVALVVFVALGWLPAVVAGLMAAGGMILSRSVTADEARRALDLQVLIAIAAAFGLGRAMQASGLDDSIADLVVGAGLDSPFLALVAVYLVTTMVTEVVTNNAAAVLAVPLALALADRVGAQPMAYMFTVMMAASASFLTPIGYQTNLMVLGPGGYRSVDYPRFGFPLSLIAGATTLTLAPMIWPL